MIVEKQGILSGLIENQPAFLRPLVRSALCIRELEQLYAHSRKHSRTSLSQGVLNSLRIEIDIHAGDLEKIPGSGPLVVVANHPFGFLDGLILHHILKGVREDIKLLANQTICHLDGLIGSLIPIDVFAPRPCTRNVLAVRDAFRWLSHGHGIATFPSGAVSHWNGNEKRVADPDWHDFPVRCALASRAPVVPVFFEGRNSVAFQLTGLLHPGLRTVGLPRELLKKRGTTVTVRIGTPITYRELAAAGDRRTATRHIRGRVYLLRSRTTPTTETTRPLLFRKRFRRQEAIGAPVSGIAAEIKSLDERGKRLVENDSYVVYGEVGYRIPLLLSEIGRLRELTFREVQEGTGKQFDLDEFDPLYTHLILWHRATASVAGSYRLAWTNDMAPAKNAGGLYTSKLFRYKPEFFSRIGAAVEVGRSFITRPHQREYGPLLLLWQGIGRRIAERPDSPVLFGAVSISTAYPQAVRELIVEFLRERCFREDLASFVSPRRAFRPHLIRRNELSSITGCLREIDELPIGDLGSNEDVPVLLRQYLRLGGRVAGFNVDSGFSDVLDALLIVDLRLTHRKLLTRYMGVEMCEEFLRSAPPIIPERSLLINMQPRV